MKEKINAVYTYAYQQMSFKFLPTQTPNSTSFSVFTTKKFLSHFHKQNITIYVGKQDKKKGCAIRCDPHQFKPSPIDEPYNS